MNGGSFDFAVNKLFSNINKIHTTELGLERIKNNLGLSNIDVISYIRNKILNRYSYIYERGKNYYCEVGNIRITINSSNFCIITAHFIKK